MEPESPKQPNAKETFIGCLTLVVIVAIIAGAIIWGCGGEDNKATSSKKAKPQANAVEKHQKKGLGVSRADVIAAFAEKDFAFSGEESTPVDGQPRWMGKSSDELGRLELIGAKDDITTATVIFGVAKDNPNTAASGMVEMYILLGTIFPDWSDRNKWILSAINQVTQENKDKVTLLRDGKQIEFSAVKEMGLYFLSVEQKQ